jgi:hypothetical protein
MNAFSNELQTPNATTLTGSWSGIATANATIEYDANVERTYTPRPNAQVHSDTRR